MSRSPLNIRWLLRGGCVALCALVASPVSAALLDGIRIQTGEPGGRAPDAQVPENTAWKVIIQWKEPERAEGTANASKSATESNAYGQGIQRMDIQNYEGQQWVYIMMGKDVVYFRPETGTILTLSSEQPNEDGLRYKAGCLPELTSIGKATYRGMATYRGVTCDVYQKNHITVLLNRATRLPVAVENNEEIRHYEWGKLDHPVVVPPEVPAALKKNAEAAESRKRRYMIPQ